MIARVLTMLLALSSSHTAAATRAPDSLQFVVPPTTDGRLIYGQIDRPVGPPKAMVVMIQGSGGWTRDYNIEDWRRDTPTGYGLFKELAQRLTRFAIASARSDMRGFSCLKPGAPKFHQGGCNDPVEGLSINYATKLGDAEAVAQFASRQPGGHCLILLSHSEGTHHAARLVDEQRIQPHAYVGLGAPIQSWVGNTQWQWVGVIVRSLKQADRDGDGVTTDAEMRRNLPTTAAGRLMRDDGSLQIPHDGTPLPTPAGGWNGDEIAKLQVRLQKAYDDWRQATFSLADGTPFGPRIWGNAGWQKALQSSWIPDAWRLRRFTGPLSFHQGDRDHAVDDQGAELALKAMAPPHATFRRWPGLNHSFSPTGPRGRIPPQVADAIAADVVEAAKSCGTVPTL